MKRKKVVFIGLDGVPFNMIDDLASRGVMPNFQKLKEEGYFRRVEATIPDVSSISWSSIMTGKNPGEHGIFGFMEIIEGTYTLRFPNFKSNMEKPFWEGKKAAIINMPMTYPAQKLDGVMVSGFVALDLEQAVYPQEELSFFKDMNYRVDADTQLAKESKDLFLKDLRDTLELRKRAVDHYWNKQDWDVFAVVFTGTDRIGHYFQRAYKDSNHKYHKEFLNFYSEVDKALGKIVDKMDKKDYLIMLSDHGMKPIKSNVYVNKFLEQEGYLSMDKVKNGSDFSGINEKTKAFALDPGRIYLHYKDRYPNGSIEKNDRVQILSDIEKSFLNLESRGEKVIKKVFKKEDLYEGKYSKNAPDLVLLAKHGYGLRGRVGAQTVFGSDDIFEGTHSQDDAFLLVNERALQKSKDVVLNVGSVQGTIKIINNLL